ncbi:hypothetical protein [Nannocystis pusilla]|uniref:hypothetical protein n=1 Tax=Nannocystis pusilla TaxID=889268 RepID=UPI003B7CD7D4
MSNVDAELLAAALSSAPPLVELDVEVDVDVVLPELLDVCATEVTPGPVVNACGPSLPQPRAARAAARAR